MTYVTPKELELANNFLKEGVAPSDYDDVGQKRMEYGLLWLCYDLVWTGFYSMKAVKRDPPSIGELRELRKVVWDTEARERLF